MKPVCLVIGAGAGIGGNVARRFAQKGYHACLCRRSDLDGLNRMGSDQSALGREHYEFKAAALDASRWAPVGAETLAGLFASDAANTVRQVAMIDARGGRIDHMKCK